MAADRPRLDPSCWEPRPIAPIPALAELREEVLRHSEKRCPKWKFRLAPDLIAQLQPKPVHLLSEWAKAQGRPQRILSFDGCACFGPGLTRETFARRRRSDALRQNFELYATASASWWIKAMSATCARRDRDTGQFVAVDCETLFQRVIQALTPATLENLPAVMLSPNCLICGKGLTDPASMARFIGPECASSSSLVVPHTLSLVQHDST